MMAIQNVQGALWLIAFLAYCIFLTRAILAGGDYADGFCTAGVLLALCSFLGSNILTAYLKGLFAQ